MWWQRVRSQLQHASCRGSPGWAHLKRGLAGVRGRNEASEPLTEEGAISVAPSALGADPSAFAGAFPQVLQTLGTETYRPSSASQCVAGIACAEIPMSQWPELIPQLVANVTNQHSTEHMKESTLEAIGYICQDIVSMSQCAELP